MESLWGTSPVLNVWEMGESPRVPGYPTPYWYVIFVCGGVGSRRGTQVLQQARQALYQWTKYPAQVCKLKVIIVFREAESIPPSKAALDHKDAPSLTQCYSVLLTNPVSSAHANVIFILLPTLLCTFWSRSLSFKSTPKLLSTFTFNFPDTDLRDSGMCCSFCL